jgi:hypothetical protein
MRKSFTYSIGICQRLMDAFSIKADEQGSLTGSGRYVDQGFTALQVGQAFLSLLREYRGICYSDVEALADPLSLFPHPLRGCLSSSQSRVPYRYHFVQDWYALRGYFDLPALL